MTDLFEGAIFEHPYPFSRDTYTQWDEDGATEGKTWKPGVRFIDCGPEDVEPVCDGMGRQIVTVVSVHKPGRFPERVFFTRQWESPDGLRFGKTNLRCKTTQAFRRLIRGYRYSDYRMVANGEGA